MILIAHVPCAYYRRRLAVPDALQHDYQGEDLGEAADVVKSLASLRVDAYVARVVKAKVQFHPVSV